MKTSHPDTGKEQTEQKHGKKHLSTLSYKHTSHYAHTFFGIKNLCGHNYRRLGNLETN